MKIINDEFILIDRFEIFGGEITANDNKDKRKANYFNKFIHALIEYEKETGKFVKGVYIKRDSKYSDIFKDVKYKISRNDILNAILYATLNNEYNIAKRLSDIIVKKDKYYYDDTLLSNYIINHSMDINEYLDGEKTKLVYNDINNKFENDYIYNNVKKLELKR